MTSNDLPKPHELISQALEGRDEGKDGYRGTVERTILSEQLVLSLQEYDTSCPCLSLDRLQPEVEDILTEIVDNGGEIGDFFSEWGDFCDTVDDSIRKFSFVLPLRITVGVETDFNVGDSTLERISEEEWNDYIERTVSHQGDTKINEFKNYSDRLEDSSLFAPYENTFWRFEHEASDWFDAAYRFSTVLECILGQINYAYRCGRELPLETGGFPNLSRRHQQRGLQRPPCYLIFEDLAFSHISKNREHHATRELKPPDRDEFTEKIESVDLTETDTTQPIGQSIVRGFRSVHDAITAQDLHGTFHAYWRALEALTLIEDGDTMDMVPTRLQASMKDPVGGNPRPTTDRLVNKRNQLIHIGTDVRINTADVNLLKYLVESMMDHMIRVEERFRTENFTVDEIREVLDMANKPRDDLAKAVRSHLENFAEANDSKSGREHLQELQSIVAIYDWRGFGDNRDYEQMTLSRY